ncbi:hypothetical protein [Schlesneria sp. T3-172]|uniref:hypothetical protein n=1 Tax=Schlesneria sphaerica TaxID=3373610 RepID=UPI0037CB3969
MTGYVIQSTPGTKVFNTREAEQKEIWQEYAKTNAFGLVTLDVLNWQPKKRTSFPPSLTDDMEEAIAIEFAITFNRSQQAKTRGRWAVVMTNGHILILTGIPDEDRPSDPTAFPPCVRVGYTLEGAEFLMKSENEERHRVAHVPRSWTVAVRPLTTDGMVPQC